MNEISDFPIERGWVCPKCGRVMAPSQPYCLFCPLTTTTTTTTDWSFEEWWNKGMNQRLNEVKNSWKLDT